MPTEAGFVLATKTPSVFGVAQATPSYFSQAFGSTRVHLIDRTPLAAFPSNLVHAETPRSQDRGVWL